MLICTKHSASPSNRLAKTIASNPYEAKTAAARRTVILPELSVCEEGMLRTMGAGTRKLCVILDVDLFLFGGDKKANPMGKTYQGVLLVEGHIA